VLERAGAILLQIFPFFRWLAPIASGVLLAVLVDLGAVRRHTGAVLLVWFLLAGYFQFFGASPVVSAVALLFQTILAIALYLRWKLAK
jgi:hypothetical protein